MSTNYKLDTGRHIEIGQSCTLVRISSMDGKQSIIISRKQINEIRKSLMARSEGKICLHFVTGLNVVIFPNRMNIGFSFSGISTLLSASEFVDIYSLMNPLFVNHKAKKAIISGFFSSLFVR